MKRIGFERNGHTPNISILALLLCRICSPSIYTVNVIVFSTLFTTNNEMYLLYVLRNVYIEVIYN